MMAEHLLMWGTDEVAMDDKGKTLVYLARLQTRLDQTAKLKQQAEDIKLVNLLKKIPVQRAWDLRAWLVLCRAFPDRAQRE